MAIEININNEQKQRFIDLVCALSPENLSCDGELPYRQVREREASLRNQWETLEMEVGRKVYGSEVEGWMRRLAGVRKLAERDLEVLVRPMPRARYEADFGFNYIEIGLKNFTKDYALELVPDFQRGHVWTQEQQERFIESVLRGAVTTAGLLIQFNSPGFDGKPSGDLPDRMQCVDGLQRLTAIRRFINGEILAFGLSVSGFKGTSFDSGRYRIRIAVHAFQNRADLLQYYLDINAGGTPHPAEEIERVRRLRDEAVSSGA